MSEIDWEQYLYGKTVKCIFTPRKEYNGKPLKKELEELRGTTMEVTALWAMGEDELYPDEYALQVVGESVPDAFKRLKVVWIASGDVSILS